MAFFGGLFALSFVSPLAIERLAREGVRVEIERRVGHRIDQLTNSRIADLGRRALGKTDHEIREAQRRLREDVPRKVASVVADMLRADCECRKRMVDAAQRSEASRLASLDELRGKLLGLIEVTYASVTANLLREFKDFTGSNAVAFALLWMVTLRRRAATLQLALPALVLLGAVVVTGSLYLFKQDWLHTVVYGQYVGLAYAGYLIAAALCLADIGFNRARVTSRLLNAGFQLVGAALKAVPC